MDVILQGIIYSDTSRIIEEFKKCSFVDKIILSTWIGQDYQDDSITIVYSEDIDNPGIGNRNRQIKSSRQGLKEVESSVCAKFRTDQFFPVDTLYEMRDFFNFRRLNNNYQILTLGLYKNWPFHPQDHVFWGYTDRMKSLFDIPYDPQELVPMLDYDQVLRAEAWIAANYIAKYDIQVKYQLEQYQLFLVDSAPKIEHGLALSKLILHDYFYPFPQLNFSWPKIGLSQYYYDYSKREFSHYTCEDIG